MQTQQHVPLQPQLVHAPLRTRPAEEDARVDVILVGAGRKRRRWRKWKWRRYAHAHQEIGADVEVVDVRIRLPVVVQTRPSDVRVASDSRHDAEIVQRQRVGVFHGHVGHQSKGRQIVEIFHSFLGRRRRPHRDRGL